MMSLMRKQIFLQENILKKIFKNLFIIFSILLAFNSNTNAKEKWIIDKKMTTNDNTIILKSKYIARENKHLVKNINEINDNIKTNNFRVIDARSKERFDGTAPDPRKNVRSGSIPNSLCLPFKEVINAKDNTFKNRSEISKKFDEIIDSNDNNRVFSCGSGITACVLSLAYSLVNNTYSPTVYDGSWAEYGRI